MVIWLIGMSASGKTTVGAEMVKRLRADGSPWVFIDGDAMRSVMGEDLGHTVAEREKNGRRISRLCALLDSQGINALACVLSLFHEHQDWNRQNLSAYKQVYIRVSPKVLRARDNKGLYAKAEKGEIADVVGVQIPFPEPKGSDFTLDNDKESSAGDLAEKVLKGIGRNAGVRYRYADKDLLAQPFKYQYLPFEGKDFLSAYRRSREAAIARYDAAMKEFHAASNALPPKASAAEKKRAAALLGASKGLPGGAAYWAGFLAAELTPKDYSKRFPSKKKEWVTRYFFTVEPDKKNAASRRETLFQLIRRFEVCKKIDVSYEAGSMKRTAKDSSDLLNFPLFGMALLDAAAARGPESLVYQNAALKTGDILAACAPRFRTPGQMALSRAYLRRELDFMRSRHGI